jgi:hypothetical protein
MSHFHQAEFRFGNPPFPALAPRTIAAWGTDTNRIKGRPIGARESSANTALKLL